ncbi:MAG: hypothetical protein R2813_11875 [Flavobacteriales bacterium]
MHLLIQLQLVFLLLSAPAQVDSHSSIPTDFDECTVCADGLHAGEGDVLAFWQAPRIVQTKWGSESPALATDLYSIRTVLCPPQAFDMPSARDVLRIKHQLNI